jgi:exodeoxyribonuclease VII large subunit
MTARLQQAGRQRFVRQQQRLDQALSVLAALSPQRVLERGYSLVEAESGLLWRAAALQTALAESERPLPLRLHFGDGVVPIEARPVESKSTESGATE